MDTAGAIQLITLFILLLLSAFFSSAETALSTVNHVRIRALCEEGNKRAKRVDSILNHFSKMLSTILIGNNIVNIAASSLTTTFTIKIFGNVYIGIATGILTLFVLLFGEIIPKTWAKINAESISLSYGKIISTLMIILTPIIFIVDKLSNGVLHFLHIDPNQKPTHITENELKTYVDVGHEEGVIESEEREMIYNVFEFSDALAKDIMIPRIHMVSVSIDASYDELKSIFQESMYTRLPVYKGEKDCIVGFVNVKDLLFIKDTYNFSIHDIVRDAYFTYEYKKSADLLLELKEEATNVAFVLNEYGATVGMITLEDLLEEIVGEIRDEYDADEKELIQKIDDRTYLVEGSMKLDDINDTLNTSLDSEDYDSLGGIVIEYLDRLPADGEEVQLENGIRLKVQGIDQNRIVKILMTLPAAEDAESQMEDSTEEE